MPIGLEIAVIILLVLLNAVFAMSEMALVSSRKTRLKAMADDGNKGARLALQLSEDPSRFLSTVQIGITLIGVLAGAFSGATLADKLAARLAEIPGLENVAQPLSIVVVVVTITYLSLIIGELVPKQFALRNAESIAALMARPMLALASVASPVVWLLGVSTTLVLRLLGGSKQAEQTVTEEEVRMLIAEGAETGVFEQAEKHMITAVMRLADKPIRAFMTPRPDIVWADPKAGRDQILRLLSDSHHSRFPVGHGDMEETLRIVQAKDLLRQVLETGKIDLDAISHEPPIVHDAAPALQVLDVLKKAHIHMALVVDEYGGVEGLVTTTDILEAIVGSLAEHEGGEEPDIIRREDGSLLMDGTLPVDTVKDVLGLRDLPGEGDFHTLGGFVLHQMGRVPTSGDHFIWGGYRFEVVDMDGRRIDKLLIQPQRPEPEDGA